MKKLGILGGGQLGKMMCLAAADWDLETFILDTEGSSAQPYCKNFVVGYFKNYDDVVNFGRKVDVLTIEIEHVNIEALKTLEAEGIQVHPRPSALETINDKGLQKEFFVKNKIPTAPFKSFNNKSEFINYIVKEKSFNWVWKSRQGGYDGKGVVIIRSLKEAREMPDVPCIIEEIMDFECEIAVIFARNARKEVRWYDGVVMFFNEKTNMLDMQVCPAPVSKKQMHSIIDYGRKIIEQLDVCGVLAVEMFLLKNPMGNREIIVNEVAPRPHNSGHHTIEATETSQFEQHLRAILDLPLGSTAIIKPSVLLNLVGAEGYTGEAVVDGFENALNTEGVHIHLYGKRITKPFRKMGHVTILNKNVETAVETALNLKNTLRIISK